MDDYQSPRNVRSLHGNLLVLLLVFVFAGLHCRAQVYDTVSNWETITPDWEVWAESGQVVDNPDPSGINTSPYCMEVVSSSGQYDLMLLELDEPADFNVFPRYRIKVFAPPSGGDIVLKFENDEVSDWQEILMTPDPGEWFDLQFDFSGLFADNFTRMVIFVDFLGTGAGHSWYIDDVIRVDFSMDGFTSDLPIVMINTAGQAIPDEPKITAQMGIVDNGPGNVNSIDDPFNGYDGYIGIEIRGQSTQMFPKKSFGLETRDELGENLNVPLLGMPEENDWILYAPYSDKTLMRNTLSFEMATRLGGYASRTAYCELFVNGGYQGIYVLMEKIKRDKNRVDVKKLTSDDNTGMAVTGGYLFKVDKVDWDFVYGQDGWLSAPNPSYPNAMDITFQFVYPGSDSITSQQKNYLIDCVSTAEEELIGPYFADPETGYHHWFNVGSFVDQMILNEISKEVDAYRYSTFFHKHNQEDGGKIFAGPAWDFNLGYGNVDYWEPGINITGWVYDDVSPVPWSIMYWWKRLMEDAYFRNLFNTRWTGLRDELFSDASLLALTDSLAERLDGAWERNFTRWPIIGEYVWPNYFVGETWEEDRIYMEDFLLDRVAWIDGNVPGSPLNPQAMISGGLSKITVELSDEYFNSPVLWTEYFELQGASEELAIDTVVYLQADKAEVYLQGNSSGEPEVSLFIDAFVLNGYSHLTSNSILLVAAETPGDPGGGIRVFAAGGAIHLSCPGREGMSAVVEIFNSLGQSAGRYKLSGKDQYKLMPELPPGPYFLLVSFDNSRQVSRFVWH